jgi:hypothetical protein
MKIAYFDCFSGISGDMIIGALIDVFLNTLSTYIYDERCKDFLFVWLVENSACV